MPAAMFALFASLLLPLTSLSAQQPPPVHPGARVRVSEECRKVWSFAMTPSSQQMEPPATPGQFMLVIPALFGGLAFGVPGAVAGGVIGDAVTDSIAGLFEGSVADWLRGRGFDESREAVTTSLGKMSGCPLGSGVVLSVALIAGIRI